MRKSKIINWLDKEVTVKELTVEEMEGFLDNYQPTPLDILLDRDAPARAVTLSTGIALGAMRSKTPSTLAPLFDAVEELNPILVAAMRRLKKIIELKLAGAALPLERPPAP
ncbi:hypothetical protein [Desulfogranum japonicum]|uniref:hypothetical protein n=1 Tax=Desulfogranum japonicum TaxID=231447 RepID=UPI00040375B7|nr:hypothetical protein [Desulfogranum japonicum]